MFKKIILLLLICCIAITGFAQKNKRKSNSTYLEEIYFKIYVNEKETPDERYCPKDSILFTFSKEDPSITEFSFYWNDSYNRIDTIADYIKLAFPITATYPNVSRYEVYFFYEFEKDSIIKGVLIDTIYVDYIRTELDTSVCQGRDITVPTAFGDTTFYKIQSDQFSKWDTLQSASGCDSLVRWNIRMEPYITEEFSISSCDSVIWEHFVVKRPLNYDDDYTETVDSVFLAKNPESSCDTLKSLTITIIDEHKLTVNFDQKAFCAGDDMEGAIELETNFTAFDWLYKDTDSTFTEYVTRIEIEDPGVYRVIAYMDTSLYDTLKNLQIVNCFYKDSLLVEDCPVEIPNIITPNGDGINDILGIKKLNPVRKNELTIHDRWGKNVFQKKNYKCIYKKQEYLNTDGAFDGKSQGGQELPDGTYYYAFKYESIPKGKTYTGTIVILRGK
ncbi:MAG: gliding motility-associated C-terminal domain-containing protein [Bacteroidales bacterium]|jgi:gliding motility-associated-like protein|nr:gliding motility-associated C-terminal domain-containing protein [Bacteroidales bacterium]